MKYELVRSRRRRRSASLNIDRQGRVVVRAPWLMPKFMIDRFVAGHTRWIEKRLHEHTAPKPKASRFLSEEKLKVLIASLVRRYAASMQLSPTGLRYKLVHSYWGTCSPKGVLTFNLRLAFTSREAVEYVVVHELSHLRYRGHGERFWKLVETTYPGTKAIRKLLREHNRRWE